MGIAFDYAPDRPEHIEAILNGLDRYNPETTTIFQDYVTQQCEDRTYDCYANLALLKLYQFNPHLLHPDTVTAILTKSLTVHPSPDFSLCLHLLPAHTTLAPANTTTPQTPLDPLTDAIHKLTLLNAHLETASYALFWQTLDSDDLYADLTADVTGFEELMRVRIAVAVGQACREVERGVLEGWLGFSGPGRGGGSGAGKAFEGFVVGVCGWGIDDVEGVVRVPVNKENEAKGTVVREEVRFEGFGRVVRRAFEEPA